MVKDNMLLYENGENIQKGDRMSVFLPNNQHIICHFTEVDCGIRQVQKPDGTTEQIPQKQDMFITTTGQSIDINTLAECKLYYVIDAECVDCSPVATEEEVKN